MNTPDSYSITWLTGGALMQMAAQVMIEVLAFAVLMVLAFVAGRLWARWDQRREAVIDANRYGLSAKDHRPLVGCGPAPEGLEPIIERIDV